jgi:hypothetical protein
MGCELIAGYNKPQCRSTGGIKQIVVYPLKNRTTGGTLEYEDGEITALTLASGKYAYPFELEQDLSSFVETPTGSRENNTFFVEQAGTIILNDNRKETRNLINLMGRSTGLGVIGEDQDGVWRHYGLIGGMTLDEGEVGSGTARGDRNGSSLTLNATENELAPEIAANIVTALLAPES